MLFSNMMNPTHILILSLLAFLNYLLMASTLVVVKFTATSYFYIHSIITVNISTIYRF